MMHQRFATALTAVGLLALGGCELGPKRSTQTGYRGTGMQQVTNLNLVAKTAYIPPAVYAAPDDSGPRAGATYQNVRVLGNVSTERFNHFMAQITNWIVPANLPAEQGGCNYCHNPANMAEDSKYTKVVARRMIQMTQTINTKWSSHVQGTGVTCWTCHRGNAVPQHHWNLAEVSDTRTIWGNKRGQNTPDANVAFASLPYDPFEHYLRGTSASGRDQIRVAASQSHPSPDHVVSIKEAEGTYGLMMHISGALGVNCTYCHNTQSFRAWNLSRSQRATAYYGIRMVGNINDEYISSLASVFPPARKGPMGDPLKANCLTCHQGLPKPLNGVSMRADNPVLWPASLPVASVGARAPAADPNATATSCNTEFASALQGKTIEFDTAKATIRPVSTPLLDSLVQIAGRCSNFHMAVAGHTDAVGNAAANMTLSQARAASVENYLTSKGVAAAQMSATGFGATKPIDTSGTPQGNQRNRRIEITVATPTGGAATGK